MNVLTFVKFFPKEDFSRTNLVGLEGVEPVAIENEIVKGIHAIQFECFRVCLSTLTTTTRTPGIPPRDSMAILNSLGEVTEFPSLAKLLIWAFTCAAFRSHASLPPYGSMKWICFTCVLECEESTLQKELYTISGSIRHYLAWNMLR